MIAVLLVFAVLLVEGVIFLVRVIGLAFWLSFVALEVVWEFGERLAALTAAAIISRRRK